MRCAEHQLVIVQYSPRGRANAYGEHKLVDGIDHEEMQRLERHERFVCVARVLRGRNHTAT